MVRKYDLQPGQKFGRLTLTGDREYRGRNIYERCVCECGKEKWIPRGNIIQGITQSCGCLAKDNCREIQAKYSTKHGLAKTRIYHIYQGIKKRVGNKKHISYKYYGAKGVRCLWESFEDFYKDMGESYMQHIMKYGEKQTTIDRIDRHGDYCKENCKRSSWKEQMHNRDVVDVYGFNYNNLRIKDEKKSD